ncbi:HNH endonuclease [Clostridium sp. ZBS2]|uniref:HNH endonuclease n=1 Tax=Clostridium sp. ZBS2 TaxID=2949976 RepID=UPI002079DE0C|nr:HNH endonuclease [Clostridium sp. ZBS2]
MNYFYYPVKLKRWNIFDKTDGLGDIVDFYATGATNIGDFIIFYVGKNIYERQPGIYAYGIVIDVGIEIETNKKYCYIKLTTIQYDYPLIDFERCKQLIIPYNSNHIIKDEKLVELQKYIKNSPEIEIVSENDIKKYINTKESHSNSISYNKKPVAKKAVQEDSKGKKYYPRSIQVSINALCLAKHMCEINKKHETFIRKKDDTNYTETHHLIPLSKYEDFEFSLDVEENIVSLCSNCHNLLHYGKDFESVLKKLYEERKELLKSVGLEITYEKLLSYYR